MCCALIVVSCIELCLTSIAPSVDRSCSNISISTRLRVQVLSSRQSSASMSVSIKSSIAPCRDTAVALSNNDGILKQRESRSTYTVRQDTMDTSMDIAAESALTNATAQNNPLLPWKPSTRLYPQSKNLMTRNTEIHAKVGLRHKSSRKQCERRPLNYWETLGQVRNKEVDFAWPREKNSFLGYRKELGRVYYDSFRFRGVKYLVGDFVWVTESVGSKTQKRLCRIVSSFQALKSFMGYWSRKRSGIKEEIQKRGQ